MIGNLVLPLDFALIVVTATALSFIAKRTGQPTIVAYILTGLLLGPVFFNIVSESEVTRLMSELGLAFLLFLIGIELDFDEIQDILSPVVRIALGQTVLQTSLAFAVSYLLGFSLVETMVLAVCTVFGATPVVVKILADKDEISTLPGKIDVGVLIIQDIILVVTLAVMSAESLSSFTEIGISLGKIVMMSGLIGVLSYTSSRYFLPQVFDRVAENQEALLIHGIAWAFLFISLSDLLGISIEVGAFLAGLSLGQLPYSAELQERIRPLTNFFIMIFFSSIGLTLERAGLLLYWKEAVLGSLVLMAGNFVIMFYLIDRENFTPETSFLGSINMIQVSEFSLVVGALAVSRGFIDGNILGYLSMMALITMSSSSYIINSNRKIYHRVEHLLQMFESEDKKDVEIRELKNHALVIGYDELTRNLLPVLKQHYQDVVVVDRNPENIERLASSDYEFIYGDFHHGEIRKASGIEKAQFVLSVAPDPELNRRMLEHVDPGAIIFLKSDDLEKAAELYELGAHYVITRNILTGERLSEYIKLYLEDESLFREEIQSDINKIRYGGEKE